MNQKKEITLRFVETIYHFNNGGGLVNILHRYFTLIKLYVILLLVNYKKGY